jgi:hypothetical protein
MGSEGFLGKFHGLLFVARIPEEMVCAPPKSAQKAQKAPLHMRRIVDIPAGVQSFVRWS